LRDNGRFSVYGWLDQCLGAILMGIFVMWTSHLVFALLCPCLGNHQTPHKSGNEGCSTTRNLMTFSWDTWLTLFPVQLFLTSRCPFLITFTTKSHLRSETHTAYKFYTLYHQTTVFSDENVYLCVENEMRVLDPFFLHIKSWCKSPLHI